MTDQVIPVEAVEAAAFVISYRMSATEDDWQTVARAALEAAAPHMQKTNEGGGMNITEFLEARIAEDESRAWSELSAEYFTDNAWPEECARRVLAECVAKRVIVGRYVYSPAPNTYDLALLDVMRVLAAVYKDSPDYQQEWAL